VGAGSGDALEELVVERPGHGSTVRVRAGRRPAGGPQRRPPGSPGNAEEGKDGAGAAAGTSVACPPKATLSLSLRRGSVSKHSRHFEEPADAAPSA
jgi:hypothetical protein